MQPTFNPQAAFEQLTQRLDSMQESQQQTQQVLLQTVEIQTGMLGSLRQLQATQAEMQATQAEMQADIRQLRDSHLALLKVQNGMLDYMKFTFDQQAKWNERQDQFNIIFLDELRDMRREVRQRDAEAQKAHDTLYGEIKTRIERLEDFMNDQFRKAS